MRLLRITNPARTRASQNGHHRRRRSISGSIALNKLQLTLDQAELARICHVEHVLGAKVQLKQSGQLSLTPVQTHVVFGGERRSTLGRYRHHYVLHVTMLVGLPIYYIIVRFLFERSI